MRIAMVLTPKGTVPGAMGSDLPMNAYAATLMANGRGFTFDFFTGTGWTRPPSIGDVMESLCLDASTTVEDADDMGLKPSTWEAIGITRQKMYRLLGEEYDRIVFNGPEDGWSSVAHGEEYDF